MCQVFTRERLLERAASGQLRMQISLSPITPPFTDYKGQTCITSQEIIIFDDAYPVGHDRHEVVRAHRFVTDTGTFGASGLIDPKDIMIGDVNYRLLKTKNPHCTICERGDMISPGDRFHGSKYRPNWPLPKRAWAWIRWLPFRVMMKV